MYFTGQAGLPRDLDKSFQYLEQAAMSGNENARYMFGLHFAVGEAVPKDMELSYAWVSIAPDSSIRDDHLQDMREAIGPDGVQRAEETARRLLADLTPN